MSADVELAVPAGNRLRPAGRPVLSRPAGRFWLIEALPGQSLRARDCQALAAADVLIYDSILGPALEAALPGAYAETAGSEEAALARCVRLVRDGWSVARLADASLDFGARCRRLRRLAESMLAAELAPGFPGDAAIDDASLAVSAAGELLRDGPLTIAFGDLDMPGPLLLPGVPNGLAG